MGIAHGLIKNLVILSPQVRHLAGLALVSSYWDTLSLS